MVPIFVSGWTPHTPVGFFFFNLGTTGTYVEEIRGRLRLVDLSRTPHGTFFFFEVGFPYLGNGYKKWPNRAAFCAVF